MLRFKQPRFNLPLRLPQVQDPARDVRSGLTFLGFSEDLSLTAVTLFADQILAALQQAGPEKWSECTLASLSERPKT